MEKTKELSAEEHTALYEAEQRARRADYPGMELYCRIIWDAARAYVPKETDNGKD